LGGSRENNPYLGHHWAGRGYVVVFMQHIGSDESVWEDKGMLAGYMGLKRAANAQNLLLRAQDVPAVINQLEVWNGVPGNPLYQRMDLSHIGMTGHSFGAVTTEAVSGEVYPGYGSKFLEPRIDAALPMSG